MCTYKSDIFDEINQNLKADPKLSGIFKTKWTLSFELMKIFYD